MWGEAGREKLKALVAMMGASGSGKTFSSLLLAKGMIEELYPDLDNTSREFWNKIGVIDTEHNRSKIYADMEKHGHYIGKFMHANIQPPFEPDAYIQALKTAKQHGIEVVIIDSTTHAWDWIRAHQQELGGRYQDWKEPDKIYQEFIKALTQTDLHIIATMRAKQKYALESSDTGKLSVVKLGEQPQQRDSFEYEFLLALSFNQNHKAYATKDNTPLFEPLGEFLVDTKHGRDLMAWLDKGEDVMAKKREERQKYIDKIKAYKGVYDELDAFITDMENKVNETYPGGFLDLEPERLKKFIRMVEAKKIELEKQVGPEPEEKQLEPEVKEEPKPEMSKYKQVALEKIDKYMKQESTELAMYIQDLETKVKETYKVALADLDDNNLAKIMNRIEKKRADIQEQIAKAKEEHQEKASGTRYYYHSESDSVFKLEDGEELGEDMDGQVVEITKERYDIMMGAEEVDYSKMTVPELRKKAKEAGIENSSTLKKAELIEALQEV